MIKALSSKSFPILLALGLSIVSPASLLGQDSAAERGKKTYEQKCITCHGADGLGVEAQQGPKLAGQFSWYIEKQLQSFLSGERKNPKMMESIKTLSSQEVMDLAAYISAMTIEAPVN